MVELLDQEDQLEVVQQILVVEVVVGEMQALHQDQVVAEL